MVQPTGPGLRQQGVIQSPGMPKPNRKISDHKQGRKVSEKDFPTMDGKPANTVSASLVDKMEFPTLAGLKRNAPGPDLMKAMREDGGRPKWNQDINYGNKRQVNKPCNQIPAERPSMPVNYTKNLNSNTTNNTNVGTSVFIVDKVSKKDFPGLGSTGVNPKKEAARVKRKADNQKHNEFIAAMEKESSEEETQSRAVQKKIHRRDKDRQYSDSEDEVVPKKFAAGDFPGLGGAPEPQNYNSNKKSNRNDSPDLGAEYFPGLGGGPKNNVICGMNIDKTSGGRNNNDGIGKKKGKKGAKGGVDLNAHLAKEWKAGPIVQQQTQKPAPQQQQPTSEFPSMAFEAIPEEENLIKKMHRKPEPIVAEQPKKPAKKRGPANILDEPETWECHAPNYELERQQKLERQEIEAQQQNEESRNLHARQNAKNMKDTEMFPGLDNEFVPDDQNILIKAQNAKFKKTKTKKGGFQPSYGFVQENHVEQYPGIDTFNPMLGESKNTDCFQGYADKPKAPKKKTKRKPVWEQEESQVDEWKCEPLTYGSKNEKKEPEPVKNYQQEDEMARVDKKFKEEEYFPGLDMGGVSKSGPNMLDQLKMKPKEKEILINKPQTMEERWAAMDDKPEINHVQKIKEEERKMESNTAKAKREREAKKKNVDELAFPGMDAPKNSKHKSKKNAGDFTEDFPGLGGGPNRNNPDDWGTQKIEDPINVVISKKSKKGKKKVF